MRSKKALYNNLSAILLQSMILLFGLITPRLMINLYGSELNGLVSSSKQIISYLKYLELGISSALVYMLYKPIAYKDYNEINPLVSRAKTEYNKIGFGYFIGAILISALYPLLLKSSFNYLFIFIVILIIGIYGAIDFLSLSKYRVLLQADQKEYVISLITSLSTFLQNMATIFLIYIGQSIILVLIIPTVFLSMRSVFLRYYVKKNYPSVDYKTTSSNIVLNSRKDAFISGLSNTINISLPIIAVSITVSLEKASVFSIYNMVFLGLAGVVGVFETGMAAAFGNMFSKNEHNNIIKNNDYYELILYMVLSVLFASALALIMPFIQIYTRGIEDTNYIYPSLGILFTIWSVIHNTRIPKQTIINASGNWSMITKTNIIQLIILVIGLFSMGFLFEIEGILIAMIVASVFKMITLINVSNNKILSIKSSLSIRRIIRIFIVIGLVNIPMFLGLININPSNLLLWTVWAMAIVMISVVVTMFMNLLFDKNSLVGLIKRYYIKIFNK